MKAYTDINQSKKLAEILPLESADEFWEYHDKWCSEGDEWEGYEDYPRAEPYLEYPRKENEWKEEKQDIPCWSLAALSEFILPYIADDDGNNYKFYLSKDDLDRWIAYYKSDDVSIYICEESDNMIDVILEMVCWLKKEEYI